MYHLTSAEKHAGTKEIRSRISQYAGCSSITNDAKLCRSNFSTNKFIDSVGGKRWDCNWYCMRNCSPEKLLPIFTNIPHHIILNDDKFYKITWVEFLFNDIRIGLRTSQHYNPITGQYLNEPIWYWSQLLDDPKAFPKFILSEEAKGYELSKLADKLCKWFKQQSSIKIKFTCSVYIGEYNTIKEHKVIEKMVQKFKKFDRPFLRPSSEWKPSGYYIQTSFILISDMDLGMNQKSSKEEIPISEILPVGLAEMEPTFLTSYGISHPELHRVSRKQRLASRYRPRHFHSPGRKEVVGRSTKTRRI